MNVKKKKKIRDLISLYVENRDVLLTNCIVIQVCNIIKRKRNAILI